MIKGRSVVLLLPVVMIGGILLLAGMSLLELRSRKEKREEPAVPPATRASKAAERPEAPSEELKAIREKARQDMTPQEFLAMLDSANDEELPERRTLVAWFRSLAEKFPGAPDELLPGLVCVWQEAHGGEKAEQRLLTIEEVLTQACLMAQWPTNLSGEGRRGLLEITRDAGLKGRPVAGALLLLLGRIGEAGDLPELRALREKATNKQFVLEIDKTIEKLGRRDVAAESRPKGVHETR